MNFILIDREIYISTHFEYTEELNKKQVSASTLSGSPSTVITGKDITGEMMLFSENGLPDFYDSDGLPRGMNVEYADDRRTYTMNDVIFTSINMLESYECDAAVVEYMAQSIDTETFERYK